MNSASIILMHAHEEPSGPLATALDLFSGALLIIVILTVLYILIYQPFGGVNWR